MQLIQSRRVSRHRKWWMRGILLGIASLVVIGWLSYRPLAARYRAWKAQRALGQAREFIQKRDVSNAQLALDVALNAMPGNLDILRVAADMLEQAGAPQAARLRRAVARANPDSVDDAAALVLCCLRFRDLNAAKDALAAFRPEFAEKPAALRAALAYAIATDNAPVIDYTYGRLKAQFPDNDDLKISHALLLLKHPKEETRTAARRELEAIEQASPKQALRIQREFAGFALAARDYVQARRWFDKVLANPAATFADRIHVANLDVLVDKKPFEPVFAQLAPLAAKNEADAGQFLQWLLVQNRAADADRWLASLPPALQQHKALAALQAEIAARMRDWDRFARLLREGAWGPVSKETVQLTDAAHAIDAHARPALRRETWELAIQSAGGNLGSLMVLQRIAATWRWDVEADRTLWTIVRGFPDQAWAHQALFDRFVARKDTAGMRELMGTLQKTDGSMTRYQHDWALLTLLTEPTSTPTTAKETMQQLYAREPANANYATGHAFALAQMRKGPEALAVIQKLTPVERDYPPRQPYLAFIHGVARDAAGVERAAKLGQGTAYLPEEERLFVRAREELVRKIVEEPPAKKKRAADAVPR